MSLNSNHSKAPASKGPATSPAKTTFDLDSHLT
jgi:hypothetical protein